MKRVNKDEFYAVIGGMNVHPQIQPGPYPYASLWKTPQDRRVVGKSVGMGGGCYDYFLNE